MIRISDARRCVVRSLIVVLVVVAPVAASANRSDARAQVEFGISVAQKGLWKEAIYRWERAVAIDPTYAAAFNNLAIAYEHEGLFDKAKEAYETGLEARSEECVYQAELRVLQGNQ